MFLNLPSLFPPSLLSSWKEVLDILGLWKPDMQALYVACLGTVAFGEFSVHLNDCIPP